MHPQIEAVFNEAEKRYLNPQELEVINQYVNSLPVRLDAYRTIRDRELEIMQQVADQLQLAMPQEATTTLEQSIKNGLLMLRYCSMGMLLNDETFVKERLINWLAGSLHNTQKIDTELYRLLNQKLYQTLSSSQLNLLTPMLNMAQQALLASAPALV
jgi:hypothetical protein